MAILTISRQTGSLGDEIAAALSRRLGWELVTRPQLVDRFFGDDLAPHERRLLSESAKFYLERNAEGVTYLELLRRRILSASEETPFILLGFGSQMMFRDSLHVINIRITASAALRSARVRRQYRVTEQEALRILELGDRKRKRFVSTLWGIDSGDSSLYDLSLSTESLSEEECVGAILALWEERAIRIRLSEETENTDIVDHQTEHPVFKNTSEEEFSRILDMYQIDWVYEPKTFPVEWDAEGNITLAFSPDFYLTKFDTYLELTTMNQKYVTEKNRKLRKVRELYPGTNIRIVYKKDFLSLIERFYANGQT